MSVEEQRNRDLFLKMCFMYYLMHILIVLGIDEEVVDVLPTELITLNIKDGFKIFDDQHDFRVLTKSGKIIIFEFKKKILRKEDLKQVYNYYWNTYCKEKTSVIPIIIVIAKEGSMKEYAEEYFTLRPRIIKTKLINKQEDLKAIRDKFKNDKILTSEECSLMITFPLFDLKESEVEIVEEMCSYLKDKKHCIPAGELDGLIMGMYLNIIEYIDSEKQDKLMEDIEMAARTKGVFQQWKEDQWNEGLNQGEKNIILELLETNTIEEVSLMIHKDVSEIKKILGIY